MPQVRVFIAASLDGYIAESDGGIGWLSPYEGADFGYDRLMAEVECVVIGRATFDMIAGFPHWPYEGKRVVVLTNRPLPALAHPVESHAGDVTPLVHGLRRDCTGDIFVDGGATTIRAFLDADLIDRMDLFTIPLLLGQGIRRFLPSSCGGAWRLDGCQAMAMGVARTTYVRP